MSALRLVVAGAIIADDGARVLLAQRSYPPEVAGLWELPGGKVEAGETPQAALRRELREELGVEVTVGAELPGRVNLRDDLILVAYVAGLVGGTPQPGEHHAIRWVVGPELDEMASAGSIVPADTIWVPPLTALLAGP